MTREPGGLVGLHPGAQGNSHLSLVAEPANANVVYIGGDRQPDRTELTTGQEPRFPNSIRANDYSGRLFRVDASRPAGAQARPITHINTSSNSAPHADSRDMAVATDGHLIEVDDGGIYRRTSPRLDTGDWFSLNGDLNTTEFHSIAWDSNADIVIGGAQDTGTPEQILTSSGRWQSVDTADGGDVSVGAGGPGLSIRYSSYQKLGRFRRRTFDSSNRRSAEVFPAFTPVGGAVAMRPGFVTPIVVNNVAPRRLVIGARNGVYESMDQGGHGDDGRSRHSRECLRSRSDRLRCHG